MRSTTFGLRGGPRPLPARKRAPLSECLELTAAYLILGSPSTPAADHEFRRKLLTVPRYELRAAVERILTAIPARRIR